MSDDAREYIAELKAAIRSKDEALREAEKALAEMIDTQDDYEKAMAKIIKYEMRVFDRAIDHARAALAEARKELGE